MNEIDTWWAVICILVIIRLQYNILIWSIYNIIYDNGIVVLFDPQLGSRKYFLMDLVKWISTSPYIRRYCSSRQLSKRISFMMVTSVNSIRLGVSIADVKLVGILGIIPRQNWKVDLLFWNDTNGFSKCCMLDRTRNRYDLCDYYKLRDPPRKKPLFSHTVQHVWHCCFFFSFMLFLRFLFFIFIRCINDPW